MKNYYCIIPARKGSKRIRNKNFKKFANSNLSEIAIKFAIKSNIFKKIIFSSDNTLFNSKLKKNYNIDIVDRSIKLSLDKTKTFDVVKKIIKDFEINKKDIIVLLQPTSPLRTLGDLKKAVNIFESNNLNSLISASIFKYENIFFDNKSKINSIKKDIYKINGAFYLSSVHWLLKNKCFFNKSTNFFIMPIDRSIDIDIISDFKKAEIRFQ